LQPPLSANQAGIPKIPSASSILLTPTLKHHQEKSSTMPDITDVFSTLHDSLIGLLKPAAGAVMQMSWPGFALSPSDFKPTANPAGPYDPQIAEETFSRICDIVPAADDLRFQDSGFEIHDVYEALIFGATPGGGTPDPSTNPMYKLLLDAQFNFLQAAKGSIEDPMLNYYPCKATPIDWYNESSTAWQPFSINPVQIKPASPASQFVKLGGTQLVNQGVLRVAAPAVTSTQLQLKLQNAVAARTVAGEAMTRTPAISSAAGHFAAAPLAAAPLAAASTAVKPADPIRAQVLARSGGTLTDAAKLKTALVQLNSQAAFKKSVQATPAAAALKVPAPALIDASKAQVVARTAPVNQRVYLDRLLVEQMPKTSIQTTSEWNLSFRYCLVNMTRGWLNNTILNLPGWYFPGTPAAFFSAGVAGQTLPQFPMLPHAFLAIRDLRISAKWSPQDLDNLSKAVSFGPFDIRNRVIVKNELHSDGLQVVAWLSNKTPQLAPTKDPSLP
jgi:hypothetical protein